MSAKLKRVAEILGEVAGQVIYDAYLDAGIKVNIVTVKNEVVKAISVETLSPVVEKYCDKILEEHNESKRLE